MYCRLGCCVGLLLMAGCGVESEQVIDNPANPPVTTNTPENTTPNDNASNPPQVVNGKTPDETTRQSPAEGDATASKLTDALQQKLDDLKSADAAVRTAAAESLESETEAAAKTVPLLVNALDDAEPAVAGAAAKAVRMLTWQSKPVLVDFWAPWCGPCRVMKPIVKQLEDAGEPVVAINTDDYPDLGRRFNVSAIPTFIVVNGSEVLDRAVGVVSKGRLERMLEQAPQSKEAEQAVENGRELGLLVALLDADPWIRFLAEAGLKSSGDKYKETFIAFAQQPDQPAFIQAAAVKALTIDSGDSGSSPDIVAVLSKLVNDDSAALGARGYAAVYFSEHGESGGDAVEPLLVKALSESTIADLRGLAATAVGRQRVEAAVPVLVKILSDGPDELTQASVASLGQFGAQAESAVPALLAAYKNGDRSEQRSVGDALNRICPSSRAAVPLLANALADEDADVRTQAASLLKQSDFVGTATDSLVELLKQENPEVQQLAATLLHRIGGHSEKIIPVIVQSLGGEQPNWEARSALTQSGRRAAPALAALIVNKTSTAQQRQQAAGILSQIWKLGKTAPPALVEALGNSDVHLKTCAAIALSTYEVNQDDILKVLISGLEEDDENLRRSCVTTLRKYRGDNEEQAVTALISALKDEDDEIAETAAYAIEGKKLTDEQQATLIQQLSERESRRLAITALNGLDAVAETAIPGLAAAVREVDENDLNNVARLLSRVGPPAINELIKLLGDENLEESRRTAVAQTLGEFADKDSQVETALKNALDDPSKSVRVAAAAGLFSARSDVKPPVSLLISGITSDNWTTKRLATNAMRALPQPQMELASAALIVMLDAPAIQTRSAAVNALANTGVDSKAVREALARVAKSDGDDERNLRYSAIHALASMGTSTQPDLTELLSPADEQTSPIVLEALMQQNELADDLRQPLNELIESDVATISIPAAVCLVRMDPESRAALKVIDETLRSGSEEELRSLTNGLYTVKSLRPTLVPALVEAIQSRTSRAIAIQQLGKLGPDAAPAVEPLVALLDSVNDFNAVASALQQIGKPAEAAVAPLMKKLENERTMSAAAAALAKISPRPQDAVAILIKQLDQPGVRANVCASLASFASVTPESVETALLAAARDNDAEFRLSAIRSLGPLKTPAAAELLIEAMSDEDQQVKTAAAQSLGTMGIEAERAVPVLVKALESSDQNLRRTAARSLGGFGKEAAPAVPALMAALDDESLRFAAVSSLGRIGSPASDAIPRLIGLLDDERAQYSVVTALGKFGPAAKAAIEPLQKLKNSPRRHLRKSAIEALQKISTTDDSQSENPGD